MFKVGQTVWCLVYGQGVVKEVDGEKAAGSYVVIVDFNNSLSDFSNSLSVDYTSDGKYYVGGNVTLFPHPVEVVKVATKPSIDWNHVSPEYNYLAQDSNGQGYLCGKNPSRHIFAWVMNSPYTRATTFTSYVPGTCDWQDSLVKRPS